MSANDTFVLTRRDLLSASAGALLLAVMPLPAFGQSASATKMKIGVIGSGRLGGAVGTLWVKSGHPVLFSSRNPDELKELVAGLGSLARAGVPREAAAFGDAILIAVPYSAIPQIGRDLATTLKGKVVLDACNAIASRDGAIADEAKTNGVGITSQKYLPGTRLVRAFNTLSYAILPRETNRPDPKMAIPIASDDAGALEVAAGLVRDAGFDPVIVGSLARASEFATGAPGYGQPVSAPELKQKLSITP